MSSEKMSIFGVGVFQYFNFLRSSTILFLFCFIFVIPMIGINYWSSYTAQGSITATISNSTNSTTGTRSTYLNTTISEATFSLFSRFTLAGLGSGKNVQVTVPYIMSSPFTLDKGYVGLGYACIDVLICLCFIFFVWYVRRQQIKDAEQVWSILFLLTDSHDCQS
jgi:hypothetical protein